MRVVKDVDGCRDDELRRFVNGRHMKEWDRSSPVPDRPVHKDCLGVGREVRLLVFKALMKPPFALSGEGQALIEEEIYLGMDMRKTDLRRFA